MARIVLVHGAWGQAAGWSKVVPALTRLGHAVEVLDLPGHGADPAPLGTVTLDDCGRAVAAVLAKGERAVLVGHQSGDERCVEVIKPGEFDGVALGHVLPGDTLDIRGHVQLGVDIDALASQQADP